MALKFRNMDKEFVRECPHCGNVTSQKPIVEKITQTFKVFDKDGEEVDEFEEYYILTKCITCDKISLFNGWELDDSFSNYAVLYPKDLKIGNEVPEAIRLSYSEAKKVKKVSSIAFLVLVRRALEFLCKEQKAGGRNLKAQLDDLAKKGIIPKTLSDMSDVLRILGNIGAHASEIKIEKEEIELVDEFFAAILEYVYVAPSKIKKLKDKLSKKL